MKRISLADLGEMISNGKLGHLTQHCGCCNKIAYATAAEARKNGAFLRAEGKNKSRAYKCPKGKGWHLTSKTHSPSATTKRPPKSGKSYRTHHPDVGW
jgi:hypothetical protein